MRKPAHYFWLASILYARVLGWPWLAWFHHATLNLSLHALGYDNSQGSATGERWLIKALARKDMRVCLDIGANVGAYSAELLARLPDAEVFALEPAAATFEELRRRLAPSGKRVTLYQAAASDTDGAGTLYSGTALAETATLDSALAPAGASGEPVALARVDTLMAKWGLTRLDFVKIDTEGFEREVLDGMQETIQRLSPKYIQFEFNRLHLYRGCTLYDLSRRLPGYALYRLLPRGLVRADPRTAKDNVFMFSNYLAVRDGAPVPR